MLKFISPSGALLTDRLHCQKCFYAGRGGGRRTSTRAWPPAMRRLAIWRTSRGSPALAKVLLCGPRRRAANVDSRAAAAKRRQARYSRWWFLTSRRGGEALEVGEARGAPAGAGAARRRRRPPARVGPGAGQGRTKSGAPAPPGRRCFWGEVKNHQRLLLPCDHFSNVRELFYTTSEG